MRNRILAQEAGVNPSVLTFGSTPDGAELRLRLLERGLLTPEISLLNIFEHYRERDWLDPQGTGQGLDDLQAHLQQVQTRPDGSPWRTTYRLPATGALVHDYLRPDGTPYLRIPQFSFGNPTSWPTAIKAVSKDGEVVEVFKSLGQWFRGWVRELTQDDEQAFVFMDSRYVVPHLVPIRAPHIYLVYVLHNLHLGGGLGRRWDSETSEIYERLLDRIPGMDAMVTLTERQRSDIAQRRGETDNLFVVPNPVEMPDATEQVERDPGLATVVARLEPQKRLQHAISAFAEVVEKVPGARLDIYGAGSRRDSLQEQIRRRGLSSSVTLRGHDPQAREALSRSSAFLMTSMFEGYPLATLESLSHGCPVVSYDVKYGPSEQITDGVDGFLVSAGDISAMADRVVQLLSSPDLVQRMSRAAVAKAEQHGNERFLADWSTVLRTAVEQKAARVRLTDAHLDVTTVEVQRSGMLEGLARAGGSPALGRFRPSSVLVLEATLRVKARGPHRDLDDARVEVAAVQRGSGAVVELPVEWRRDGNQLHLTSRAPLADLMGPSDPAGSSDAGETARLRVRLTWRNAAWQTFVERPPSTTGGLEVAYDAGVLTISRPPSAGAPAHPPG